MTVWATHPLAVATAQRGMESSLSTMFVLTTAVAYRGWCAQPGMLLRAAAVGVHLGLAILARTENVLLAVGIGLHALLSRPRHAARLLGGVAVPLVGLVGPWVVWQWQTFGSLEQASGAAVRLLRIYGHLDRGDETLWNPVTLLRQTGEVVAWLHRSALGREFEPLGWAGRGYLAFNVGLLAWMALAARGALRRSERRRFDPLGPLLVYGLLHIGYYYGVSHTYRPWYHLSLVAIAVLAGSVLAAAWVSPGTSRGVRRQWIARGALLVLLGVHAAVLVTYARRSARFPTTRTAEHRIEWIERNCGPRARVGLMDAGKLAYLAGFRSNLVVVNLDGVVNNPLLRAYRDGTFPQYYCRYLDCALQLPTDDCFRDPRLRRAYGLFRTRSVIEVPAQPAPFFRFRCPVD